MLSKPCLYCGNLLQEPKPSHFNKRKYCSRSCRSKATISAKLELREKKLAENRTLVTCLVCKKQELVSTSRNKTYKTCSVDCLKVLNRNRYTRQVKKDCVVCGNTFLTKPSSAERRKTCSRKCCGVLFSTKYAGLQNPNYSHGRKTGIKKRPRQAEYTTIVKNYLSIDFIPKGFAVHHRNCNPLDNEIENLALLDACTHTKLHALIGSILMEAYYNSKISLEVILSLIDDEADKKFIELLLPLKLSVQKETGVFKWGELLENLEIENQQPSLDSNVFEGSQTNSRVLKKYIKDSKADTSALLVEIQDDIVGATHIIKNESVELENKESLG